MHWKRIWDQILVRSSCARREPLPARRAVFCVAREAPKRCGAAGAGPRKMAFRPLQVVYRFLVRRPHPFKENAVWAIILTAHAQIPVTPIFALGTRGCSCYMNCADTVQSVPKEKYPQCSACKDKPEILKSCMCFFYCVYSCMTLHFFVLTVFPL